MTLKVLIVDDHVVARIGLAHLLEGFGFSVSGSVANGGDAIKALVTVAVDVVLLDVRLPEEDGLSTLDSIRDQHDRLPVVIFSAFSNPTYLARAVALKANAYILKNGSCQTMHKTLRQAADGAESPHACLLPRAREFMREEIDVTRLPSEFPLTVREAQVLRHLGLGLSNKDISRSLEISVETVKEHVQNIIRKIKAKDRTDAAVRAIRAGLVELQVF